MFDQLAELDTSRTTWRIKVRVTRMWASNSSASNSGEGLKGYNLILVDEDNCHMHAFVYSETWRSLANDFVEGGVYIISNFYTRVATGTLRPTSSKIIINFSNSTTVQKLPSDDFMIPNHKFEFIDLSDLFRITTDYEKEERQDIAIDIIGVLEDFEDVKTIQTKFGDRNIIKFRITDGRFSHKVTVWGHLVVKTDEQYHKITERPIIVIVTGCKLRTFKSSVQINTLPSSKIYLNLDDYVVTAMKARLDEEGYSNVVSVMDSPSLSMPQVPVIETVTLTQLAEKITAEDENRKFLCPVKISNVDEAQNWWYYCCPECLLDMIKLDGRFKCPKCPTSCPVPNKRFRIVVVAEDSVESFTFVLSDKAAKRIIGQTASMLASADNKVEDSADYPQIIKNLIGRELIFQVEISSDNVLVESKIFRAIDAYDTASSSDSPSDESIPENTASSSTENLIDLTNGLATPGSSKSVSKKPKLT